MKPTDILSHLRRLIPEHSDSLFLRTTFLNEMTQSIRLFLFVWQEQDIEKLVEIADKWHQLQTKFHWLLRLSCIRHWMANNSISLFALGKTVKNVARTDELRTELRQTDLRQMSNKSVLKRNSSSNKKN